MTLTIKKRSPKPNQVFILPQCYLYPCNLVSIIPLAHEISRTQENVTPTPVGSVTHALRQGHMFDWDVKHQNKQTNQAKPK